MPVLGVLFYIHPEETVYDSSVLALCISFYINYNSTKLIYCKYFMDKISEKLYAIHRINHLLKTF